MAEDLEYLNNLIDQGIEGSSEVEVEMALLALCMRKDVAILGVVENKIEDDDFTDVRNRTIFSVIIDMFLNNAQIDRITVYSELERRSLADKAGGQRYVYRVGDTTAVQSALPSYIDCGIPVGIQNSTVHAIESTILASTFLLASGAICLACHERRNCFHCLTVQRCLV